MVAQPIAYITDVHLDEELPFAQGVDARANWIKILQDVDARGIRRVIFGGDIGSPSAFPWFFNSLEKYEWRITLGNHDRWPDVEPYFKSVPSASDTELYFFEEDDHFKYLYLDSSSDAISSNQFQWLEKEVQTQKDLIIFVHHPILEVKTAVDRVYPLKGRDQLKAFLQQLPNPVTLFTGHYHQNHESAEGNIRQYITAASSFQISGLNRIEIDSRTLGYRLITFDNGLIQTETVEFKN